ncbi:hypothetical protein Aduo_003126 [Ancylostoma duodenale]
MTNTRRPESRTPPLAGRAVVAARLSLIALFADRRPSRRDGRGDCDAALRSFPSPPPASLNALLCRMQNNTSHHAASVHRKQMHILLQYEENAKQKSPTNRRGMQTRHSGHNAKNRGRSKPSNQGKEATKKIAQLGFGHPLPLLSKLM